MRAFVTGGSGFVGQHLIRALVGRQDQVVALARSDRAAAAVQRAGAEVARGDLHEGAALRQGMAGCDVVFHAAGVYEFWGHEAEQIRVNVDGTRAVVEAARAAGVPALVFISSAAVLMDGRPLRDVDETAPLPAEPLGAYARSKALAEQVVLAANAPGFRTVAIRPPMVWGAGDQAILPQIAKLVRRHEFVWIDGGHYRYAACHAENVCEGAILAAAHGRGGETYFVTDGPPTTFRELMTALLATQGLHPGRLILPGRLAWPLTRLLEQSWRTLHLPWAPPVNTVLLALVGGEFTINDAKARRELGYVGHFSREAGLAELRAGAVMSSANGRE